VRLPPQAWTLLLLGGLASGQAATVAPGPPVVSPQLRQWATRAASRSGWAGLRRYAAARRNAQERGLAYFVLGYREYEVGEFPAAAKDLRGAAETRFSMADLAAYYQAAAARQGGDPLQAVEALDGFSSRYPASWLRLPAVELLAQSFLEGNQPARALEVLLAEPRVRQRASLALLLAQAYQALERFPEAARAFQEVYYAFPTSSQAKEASDALTSLWSKLGPDFPLASDEMENARADALYKALRSDEALHAYEELARVRVTSPFVGRWQVGRARCLLRLRRYPEALDALAAPFVDNPTLDAERLELRVEALARQDDEQKILQTLEELQSHYAALPASAGALSTAGNFYFRKGNWAEAARRYQQLADAFPQDEHAREALWRLGVCDYLLKDRAKAEQAWADFVVRFPDAPRVAAALYWLGHLAEERAASEEARAFYALVRGRFAHSYYAVQASRRMKAQGSPPAAGAGVPTGRASALAARIAPRKEPPAFLCGPDPGRADWQRVRILQALGLESLAESALETALAEGGAEPDLRMALSELESGQGNASAALFDAIKLLPKYSDYDFSALPGPVWDWLYPRAYWKLVQRQARANGLDPYLVLGLIRQESAFNPRATSRADARGLMQILPKTATRSRRPSHLRITGRRLYDPAYNVRLGCAYLRGLIKAFDGSLEEALAAYNAGDFRVKDWLDHSTFEDSTEFLETIPFYDTRAYVEAVLRDAAIYRELMAAKPNFAECLPAAPAGKSSPRGEGPRSRGATEHGSAAPSRSSQKQFSRPERLDST